MFDGVEVQGRFINDWAYASYARGVESEARGQHDGALHFYDEALAQDPESVELWTRVGAVRCRLDRPDWASAFSEAEELNPRYEPLWRERALCAKQRSDVPLALAHARKAVAADPHRAETVLLLVRLLDESDQSEEAERWLRSLAVSQPSSTNVWRAIRDFAQGRVPSLAAHAQGRLARLQPTADAPAGAPEPAAADPWRGVDDALVAGSLEEARTQLRNAHLDMRKLAARAILVGRPELAFEEAALRASADPGDGDAHVAWAAAADLTGKGQEAATILRNFTSLRTDAEQAQLSTTGSALLAELLVRHYGVEAASLWLGEDRDKLTGEGAPRARLRRSFGESQGGRDG